MRVAAFGLILVLTSCSAFTDDAADAEKAEVLAIGEEAYGVNCASCHGMDGRGIEPAPGSEQIGSPDITRLTIENNGQYPRDYVTYVIDGRIEILSHDTRAMPLWGSQAGDPEAEATLAAIVDYVETLQRPAK